MNSTWKQIIAMEQKVWMLIEEQADYAWTFDLQKAYTLVDALTQQVVDVETKLKPLLPPQVVQLTKTESGATKAFKADGTLTAHANMWLLKNDPSPSGDFCKVAFEPFNIHSSSQVKELMLKNGWQPSEYNFKKDKHGKPIKGGNNSLILTSPKLPGNTEEWDRVAEQINIPSIKMIAEYNKASHRRSQIQGLIKNTRSDHRIGSQANTCSTNTARMTHRQVVNIPKADSKVFYGHEMRSLFVTSPGMVLVGVDASALEARCEAHYIYPYDILTANELINGDIHTRNAEVFCCDRNTAKTAKYAILYGCGPKKLENILKLPLKQAKLALQDYWLANEGCRQLITQLETEYNEKGYIRAIDGRPLTIRYKHAILNTVLQSCGSIIVKTALCIRDKMLKQKGMKAPLLGTFHDEFQCECHPEIADEVGQIGIRALEEAGKFLNLAVPITGQYKIGLNWAETH